MRVNIARTASAFDVMCGDGGGVGRGGPSSTTLALLRGGDSRRALAESVPRSYGSPRARPVPPPPRPARTTSPPEAADDGGEDDQRDVAVDVEEGEVEAREVARAHQRVLVDQEPHDRGPAEPVEEPEPREPAEQREGHGGERVVQARRRERGGDAEARGDGMEPLRAVHLDVLAGVDQVESRDPHRQREPEEERGRLERPADGDPAAG